MKKQWSILWTAAVLAALLTGCGVKAPAAPADERSEPTPGAAAGTEQVLPAATEGPTHAQATPAASPAQSGRTAFASDFGYTVTYDESSTDYRRTEGYDEFVRKSDAPDAPFVFVCVSRVGAEFVEAVTAASLGEAPEACTVGAAQMPAQSESTEETWSGGTIVRRNIVCPLEDGDALLIETQRYTGNGADAHAEWIRALLDSIEAPA